MGLRGRVSLAVSEEAQHEVARTEDQGVRATRLARLRAFDCLRLPAHRAAERDALATNLHGALFPDAKQGTRRDDHNRRDCRQMATHQLIGREVFVTRDGVLLKRRDKAKPLGVEVVSADELAQRLTALKTRAALDSQPAISVRDAKLPDDEPSVRAVLAPLAADYPDFDAWLTRRMRDPEYTRIRLGEHEGRVGAVALSARKDARVLKLSAFYVAEEARDAGLGGHLLWLELRTWVREGVEKAYVTVSSRHADLIEFFAGFGFLVEGISPRRYQEDTAEFVLAKHLPRVRVQDSDLDDFAAGIAGTVFAAPAMSVVPPATLAPAPGRGAPDTELER